MDKYELLNRCHHDQWIQGHMLFSPVSVLGNMTELWGVGVPT